MTTRAIAIAALALGALAMPAHAKDYKIAVVQSLTGGLSTVGVPVTNAIKLATDDVNSSGMLGSDKIVIEVQDNASDKGQAITLMTRYGRDPNVMAVIGPTSSIDALATSPVANELKIPMFTTAISTDILKPGPWAFKGTAPADDMMTEMAKYTIETLKVKSCSIVFGRQNDAHISWKTVFNNYLTKNGITLATEDGILDNDTDLTALATKVVARNADCVFVAALGPQSANVIVQIRQAGLPNTVKIVGTPSMATQAFLDVGGKAVEGVIFPADYVPGGSNDMGRKFAADYLKRYNVAADNYAAVGHTMLYLTALAIKNSGPNPTRDSIRQNLAALKDAPTVLGNGKFSVDEARLPHYGASMLVVRDGKFVEAK